MPAPLPFPTLIAAALLVWTLSISGETKLIQCLIAVTSADGMVRPQQQVDDGISAFLQSRVQVRYLSKSAEAARGALKIGTEQYEQGATDFTTVLTAEQNLFQAESGVATALANVALAATAIYRALGGGWQIREDSYFVTAATTDQMQARTNWGDLLPPPRAPQPPAPGLPSPGDIGPTVRPPEW